MEKTEDQQWEDQRATMFHASHQRKLYNLEVVLPNVEELKKIMLSKGPVFMYNVTHSNTKHLYQFTKIGVLEVQMFKTTDESKTAKTYSYEELYDFFVKEGITDIRY